MEREFNFVGKPMVSPTTPSFSPGDEPTLFCYGFLMGAVIQPFPKQ